MAETLYELLNRCTVRIMVPATQEQGTGFFVAPGQVMTCAHVVKGIPLGTLVQLYWQGGPNQPVQELAAQVQLRAEAQDLAVLALTDPPAHPCVWLGENAAPFQKLYTFGYPLRLTPRGTSTTVECEGWTEGEAERLLTLKAGQVSPGMSGAPLLHQEAGEVCGVIAWTRDEGSDLGGRAILTKTLWKVFPTLRDVQASWRQQDQRWRACLEAHRQARASSSPSTSAAAQAIRPKDELPFQRNPTFQERPGEFEKLEGLLFGQQQAGRVGLVGMGGVGKSSLAVELAMRHQDRFTDGIFWMLGTGTQEDWQRKLAELADKTDYRPPNDQPSDLENTARRARHIARYLAEHPQALLILDNVEQTNLAATALTKLTGNPQPACTVLYTSRHPEQPTGFMLHPVDKLSEEAALRLLLKDTRPAVLAEAQVGSQSAEAKASRNLCQKVGGLPLGLIHLRHQLADDSLSVAALEQAIDEVGALEVAATDYPDAPSLFATFAYSWNKIENERTKRLFYLAGFFPEAATIPLWLLGRAADLGEQWNAWGPLRDARLALLKHSLIEALQDGQIRLHPLVREFAQRLVGNLPDKGNNIKQDAGELLAAELTDLPRLEARARAVGYWGCLEQVRSARAYADLLGTEWRVPLARMEHWLDRESYLLATGELWPEPFPQLFFQQLFNRAVEAGQPPAPDHAPARWVRQVARVGAEDSALRWVLTGHQDAVTSVAFSPDGMKVLTGSSDNTAWIWDVQSERALVALTGHQGRVTSVSFSPDGTKVLTGSTDDTARLWDAKSGQTLLILDGDLGYVRSVAFSPDGRRLLTGTSGGTGRLWDTTSGQMLLDLIVQWAWVESVAFSPDGTKVLTGSTDNIARTWDVQSGEVLLTLTGHWAPVNSVAFSPDGTKVLTGSDDGSARLWDATSGQALGGFVKVFPHKMPHSITSVAFSPDGKRVLTGSDNQTALLWDVSDMQELLTLSGHRSKVTSVVFSPDGKRVLTGSDDQTARLWDVTSGQELLTLSVHQGEVTSAAFSPDGTKVLTGSDDQTARLWDTTSGQALLLLTGHQKSVKSVAFGPDGTKVLTGSDDQTARLWDVTSGQELLTISKHQAKVALVDFSPDGTKVVTAEAGGVFGTSHPMVRLWDALSGQELFTLTSYRSWVKSLDFSPQGHLLVTLHNDGVFFSTNQTVRLWDAQSGRELLTLTSGQEHMTIVVFSPDGECLLTGSLAYTARLLDVQSGQELATLWGHQRSVISAAFSLDGQLLVTADGAGWVRFWAGQGAERGRLLGVYLAPYPILAMHWQDGDHLLLADDGGPRHAPHFYRLKVEGM